MRLSTRSTYGMRALIELGLGAGHGPVSASFIAKRQHLSVAYLEQLLHRLKQRGLITSTRGPRGGYVLARDLQEITMAEVVQILDGGLDSRNGAGGKRMAALLTNGRTRAGRHRSDVEPPARGHTPRPRGSFPADVGGDPDEEQRP